MNRRTFVATLATVPAAMPGATFAGHRLAQSTEPPISPNAPAETGFPARVMTFNVWLGGDQVNFAKVVEAIERANADVVGVQEVEGNLEELATALGWPYASPRLQVISRYPILDLPAANGLYLLIEPEPGKVFAIANVHLPADPYGPYAVATGMKATELRALETETRLPALQVVLDAVSGLQASGIPVVITGDFNSPSHIDWLGAPEIDTGVERIPFAWPVTLAAAEAGFVDTYREIHPDPSTVIGATWTPGYPAPLVRDDEIQDRIDLVLVAGDVTVLDSQLVGESGGRDVDITVTPYPSDHRAVVSGLEMQLGSAPLFVATDRRSIAVGDPLVVRFHASGNQADRIALVPRGGGGDTAVASQVPRETWIDGSVTFGTNPLQPGAYDAVLIGAPDRLLARSPFWLQDPNSSPQLSGPATPVTIGDAFSITYRHAPGNRFDWIALVPADELDAQNFLGYWYTDAGIDGTVTAETADLADALSPGTYRLLLLADDGYEVLAETTIELVEPED